jgi:hypothetical protein
MWIVILIFPASVLLAILNGIFCAIRYGRSSFEFRLCLLFLGYLFLSYVAGFIAVSFYPYWIDNEAEEIIPQSERWAWAVPYAGVFEVVFCPLFVLGYSILRSRAARQRAFQAIQKSDALV